MYRNMNVRFYLSLCVKTTLKSHFGMKRLRDFVIMYVTLSWTPFRNVTTYTQLQKKPISHFSGQLWKTE